MSRLPTPGGDDGTWGNILNDFLQVEHNNDGTLKRLDSGLAAKVDKTTTVNSHALSGDVIVTKSDLSLGNVDNTSDANKPVSSATQTALNLKADKSNVLEKDNTTAFTPDTDYEPATKKYVDDNVSSDSTLVVNIESYGAVGDDSTDNTTALQNAIAAAATDGLAVYVPAGIFRTGPLTLPAGTVLRGVNGEGFINDVAALTSVLKLKTGSTDSLIKPDDGSNYSAYVQISDICLHGNNINQPVVNLPDAGSMGAGRFWLLQGAYVNPGQSADTGSGSAVYIGSNNNAVFLRDCIISNADNVSLGGHAGYYGLRIEGPDCFVENCWVSNFGTYNIYLGGGDSSMAGYIRGGGTFWAGYANIGVGGKGYVIRDMSIDHSQGAGVYVAKDVVLQGNVFYDNSQSSDGGAPDINIAADNIKASINGNSAKYVSGNKTSYFVYVGTHTGLVLDLSGNINNASFTGAFTNYSGYQSVNVMDFGARGDGSTNDTTAIQTALNICTAGGQVYLPKGNYIISSSLSIPNAVSLIGAGKTATKLTLGNNSNVSMLINATGAADIRIAHLKLDGNKSNQTAGHGICFTGNSSGDRRHVVNDVWIYNCKQDGFNATNDGEIYLFDVYSESNDNHGFAPTYDMYLTNCIAASSGDAGFHLTNSNIQLVGCKSFNSGTVTADNGHGFLIEGGPNLLNGCNAQDNRSRGFTLNSDADGCILAGVSAISNNRANNSHPGYRVIASNCVITGNSGNRSSSGDLNYQRNALWHTGTDNVILLSHFGSGGGTVDAGIVSGSTFGDTFCVINGDEVRWDLPTSNPGPGQLWANNNVLTIGT